MTDATATRGVTVTPVDGLFVTRMRPPYDFRPGSRDERVADERDGRTVALPGCPGIALRIRRVGGPEPLAPTEPAVPP